LGTYSILSIGPGLFYTYLVIRELGRTESTLLNYYSNLEGRRLRWIAHALYFNIGIAIIYVLLRYGFLFDNPNWGILFGAVTNTLLVTYISIQGIRQLGLRTAVEDEPDTPDEERDVAYPAEEAHPHSVLFERVDRYLRESKAYLNAQLTVGDLARELGCGERTLSRVINSETEDHFNGYINDFRIATAKELLADPAYDHYTMDAIAEEAGFNSKATFYKAFRRHSDLSPAVYRRQHRAA
jgi:AraC-like DNA-binding protein